MSEPTQRRRTIWLVDDSQLDAQRAHQALTPEHDVVVFSEGASMLARLAAGPEPDVLVLDWVLAGLSGIEICEILRGRSDPQAAGPAILLLTAERSPEQVVTALAAGADDYLPKPYSDAELRARVGALVRTRALVERLAQTPTSG
jgi:DNA-binding response OmpR family regulator